MPTDTEPPLRREPTAFSLTEGGPFSRLLYRLHVRTRGGKERYWWLGFVLWAPLAISALVRAAFDMPRDPFVFDISVHVRLLFMLPVMLYGEQLLDRAARSAIASLYAGNYCDRAAIDRIVERAERLRDSWKAELVLLALAVLGGQLVLWQVFGPAGLFYGSERAGFWSFTRVWYALVALPVVQFVIGRWLWHWLIWSYMLARIARLPLFVLATHPDQAGGLTCLARPVAGFAIFVLAEHAVLAAAWGTQVLVGTTTLDALLPMLVASVALALIVALAPLLLLTPHLFRARVRTLAEYGDFARGYVLAFHARWLERGGTGQEALGSGDIQSLADLGNSFHTAASTRLVPFGPRTVVLLCLAAILPTLPLFASALTFEQLVRRIATTALGALPI